MTRDAVTRPRVPGAITLDALRRHAVTRSLVPSATLAAAVERMGFVQADPIRAPARAQDLTLRHRVTGYRAGDLEARYPRLDIEEDFFVNYGFLARPVAELLQPRRGMVGLGPRQRARAEALVDFVRERGHAHPREVDRHFAHGRVTNYWGGSSSATTHLLTDLHYRGVLRVSRRDEGIRVYAVRDVATGVLDRDTRRARVDALIDVIVRLYGPLPAGSLSALVGRLRWGVPQWRGEIRAALQRGRARLSRARVEGAEWYWPTDERVARDAAPGVVRLLAPFDPVTWDRRRFEHFWGWAYRFEAYTPAPKRTLGYYALPLLWRDQVVGWANVAVRAGELHVHLGYASGKPPGDTRFGRALDAELDRLRTFLRIERATRAG